MRTTARTLAILSMFAMLGACESNAGPDGPMIDAADHVVVTTDDGVLLLTQDATDGSAMDALFNGSITLDDRGCLRLQSASGDGATAVWPADYSLDRSGDAVRVVDADGTVVGALGGAFTFGGGEVAELTADMGFTADDQALAQDRCPGRFWIVNAL